MHPTPFAQAVRRAFLREMAMPHSQPAQNRQLARIKTVNTEKRAGLSPNLTADQARELQQTLRGREAAIAGE